MPIPRRIFFVSLAVVVLGSVAFFYSKSGSQGPSGDQTDAAASELFSGGSTAAPAGETELAPLPVRVARAMRGDLVMTIRAPGEVCAEKQAVLKAGVDGVVRRVWAGESRPVRENELLVEMDDLECRLRLEKSQALRLKSLSEAYLEKRFASADIELAPPVFDRINKLHAEWDRAIAACQKGLNSQADMERAQKDYELALIESGLKKDEIMASAKGLTQAEIDVKIARMDLEKTRIRAPFAGVITDIKVSAGESLEAGRDLLTLVDVSRLNVKAKVLESEAGKIRPGRDAILRFSAHPGKVFQGRVEAVSPVILAAERTCAVFIRVMNPSEEIKPGMHAEAEIVTETYRQRLLVPQEAILVRGGRKLVFIVEEGVAKWRYIEVGVENARFAEVLSSSEPGSGVRENAAVIVEGHFALAHDTRVSFRE